jgi:hypothetical protein
MLITISGEPKEMKPLLAFMTGAKALKGKQTEEDEEDEEEEPSDDEEEPSDDEEEIEIEGLVKLCQLKTKKNPANKAKIAAILKELKTKTLTDLKPAKFAAFKAKVSKLK